MEFDDKVHREGAGGFVQHPVKTVRWADGGERDTKRVDNESIVPRGHYDLVVILTACYLPILYSPFLLFSLSPFLSFCLSVCLDLCRWR